MHVHPGPHPVSFVPSTKLLHQKPHKETPACPLSSLPKTPTPGTPALSPLGRESHRRVPSLGPSSQVGRCCPCPQVDHKSPTASSSLGSPPSFLSEEAQLRVRGESKRTGHREAQTGSLLNLRSACFPQGSYPSRRWHPCPCA